MNQHPKLQKVHSESYKGAVTNSDNLDKENVHQRTSAQMM